MARCLLLSISVHLSHYFIVFFYRYGVTMSQISFVKPVGKIFNPFSFVGSRHRAADKNKKNIYNLVNDWSVIESIRRFHKCTRFSMCSFVEQHTTR